MGGNGHKDCEGESWGGCTAAAKATDSKQKSAVMWKQKAHRRFNRKEEWDVAASCCQS